MIKITLIRDRDKVWEFSAKTHNLSHLGIQCCIYKKGVNSLVFLTDLRNVFVEITP